MRQWKIALSLAIIAALAGPLAFRTYKIKPPQLETWIPLTEEGKRVISAYMKETNNCQDYVDRGVDVVLIERCRITKKSLEDGGGYWERPSRLLYLAINAGTAIIAFGAVFGLTYLLPALTRRYWRWLKA